MPTAKSGNGRVEVRKTYKLFINGEFVRSESGRAYRFDGNVNIPRGSRKDLRDAVRAARGAVSGWAARTAMNRGQILYRAAEMLDGRRAQFVELLGSARAAHKEVDDAVEALVWYAGWTDKLAQVIGATNPVSGPYFNFTIPEPTGVAAPRADPGGGAGDERPTCRRRERAERISQGTAALARLAHGRERDRRRRLHIG